MNRLHVHVSVEDLERSIRFYKTLLGAEPTVLKHDYAKWRLDEPAVNFAISARTGAVPGIEHLGIEASSHERLTAITERLKAAEESTFDQEATTCCYAVSDKSWVEDPSGVRWEKRSSLMASPRPMASMHPSWALRVRRRSKRQAGVVRLVGFSKGSLRLEAWWTISFGLKRP